MRLLFWDWYGLLSGRGKWHPQADEGGVKESLSPSSCRIYFVFLAMVRGRPLWHAASKKVLTCLRGGKQWGKRHMGPQHQQEPGKGFFSVPSPAGFILLSVQVPSDSCL
jgi:hypothetical protein